MAGQFKQKATIKTETTVMNVDKVTVARAKMRLPFDCWCNPLPFVAAMYSWPTNFFAIVFIIIAFGFFVNILTMFYFWVYVSICLSLLIYAQF